MVSIQLINYALAKLYAVVIQIEIGNIYANIEIKYFYQPSIDGNLFLLPLTNKKLYECISFHLTNISNVR